MRSLRHEECAEGRKRELRVRFIARPPAAPFRRAFPRRRSLCALGVRFNRQTGRSPCRVESLTRSHEASTPSPRVGL